MLSFVPVKGTPHHMYTHTHVHTSVSPQKSSLLVVIISLSASNVISLKLCVARMFSQQGNGNLPQVAGFLGRLSDTESGFHQLKGCASAFVDQPLEMPSLGNDLGLARVSCRRLHFLKPENRAKRMYLSQGVLTNNFKSSMLKGYCGICQITPKMYFLTQV